MTHKYERVSKVITELFGDNDVFEMIDHGNLVHFAYAVLEEFDGPRVSDGDKDESH
jgi:hypothetical protein